MRNPRACGSLAQHSGDFVLMFLCGLMLMLMLLSHFQTANAIGGSTTEAKKIAAGEPVRQFVKAGDMLNAFFEFLEPPRILSADVLKKTIAKGVGEGQFAWFSGATPQLGADNRVQVSREKILFGRTIGEDEVDFETGWLIVPGVLPEAAPTPTSAGQLQEQPGAQTTAANTTSPSTSTAAPSGTTPDKRTSVALRFTATRDQIYKAFPAIANLADKSDGGEITIQVEGKNARGFDPAWLRNAVEEPLEEANVKRSGDSQ